MSVFHIIIYVLMSTKCCLPCTAVCIWDWLRNVMRYDDHSICMHYVIRAQLI